MNRRVFLTQSLTLAGGPWLTNLRLLAQAEAEQPTLVEGDLIAPHEVDERSGIVANFRRSADRAQPAEDRFLAEDILRIHYRQRTLLSP